MDKKILNKLSSLVFYFSILLFIIAFNFAHNPPGGWYQQFLPDLGGRSIVDITFTDSLTGYAITSISSDTSLVMKTNNGGDNWTIIHSEGGFIMTSIQFLNKDTGFVGGTHVIGTTNGGVNWNTISSFAFLNELYFINSDTGWYADSEGLEGGVFRTTNGGVNWQRQLYLGNQNPTNIYFYNKDIGFVAENVLYKTTNSGLNWLQIPGGGFGDMHFINVTTGWKCYGPMQKTTDGGASWINQPLPQGGNIILSQMREFSNVNDDTIWGVGGHVFYPGIGNRGMIYRTTNGGNNWLYQVPDTNINIGVYSYIDFHNQLTGWAYSSGPGVHTIVGGDSIFYPITSISQISSEIPKDFKLYQNYPNPFNPVTIINYELRITNYINLKIYNIEGKELKTLVNKKQNGGKYKVKFDGSNLPSGVYFYSLIVEGSVVDTKKMVLVR